MENTMETPMNKERPTLGAEKVSTGAKRPSSGALLSYAEISAILLGA
jgi:hypothetical protein